MEKGQMRVEVNISLTPNAYNLKPKLGTKVEIKNLNSFRAVEKAIEYEIERQTGILKSNKKVIQETRGFDDIKGVTVSQRTKEEAHDYRYFPEPDLPPLKISNLKSQISNLMIELPQQKRERFKREYNLSEKEVEILVRNKDLSDYFEKVISEIRNWVKFKKIPKSQLSAVTKVAANYLESDLLGLIKEQATSDRQQATIIKDLKIAPENFAELITILWRGEISSRVGKDVLIQMFETGADPTYVIKEKDLRQVSDKGEIESIAKKIIKENQKAVEDYKKGKENAIQFLIGGVMRESKGRTNPEEVKKIFKKLLR
jgi:aspartyl-tRNA(Asn)/glutamyl-tRNA(Gln) amidotransferase subunit B